MEFNKVVTVKKEHSKEQFLRGAMIKLASDIETPIDVVKADFGEVKESVKEVILCTAHVESDYTASIGYDRQEQYQTTESKFLSEGDWYTCKGVQKRADHSGSYQVDVIKTRTVTDWQPYSGHIGGDATCVAMNGSEEYSEGRLIDVIKSIKDESVVEKGEAVVSSVGLKEVKENCRGIVESKIDFPGDHYKDVHSNASVDVDTLECWKLPFYEAEYTYKGKKYKISDYACGDFEIEAECPPNDVNIVAVASNDTKAYRTGMIVGWSVFGLLFVLSCVLMAANVYWMWSLTTVSLAVAITLHVVSDKKYFARVRALTEDNVVLKRKELENVLSQKGYERLTSAEAGLFNAESEGASYAYSNKRKGVKVPAILCSIATIILIIVSSVLGANAKSNALHSPDQFTVAITSKTQEYKENVSPYTNGCYYIYLNYQITADEIGVDYIKFKTTVSDKSGKELGTITSSLDTMNLDAGGKKNYETYLQENQPQKNAFFSTLYDANYSDLVFTYEILSIKFSDGEYYHGNNNFY